MSESAIVGEVPSGITRVDSERARGARTRAYAFAVALGLVPIFISQQLWIVPLIAMMMYLFIGYGGAKRDGMVFEFADAFYYLGFTLSVGALLAALEPFNLHSRPDPERIFHQFGLGMLTTLAGVVGRTLLQTFHRLPAETLEATNRQLEEQTQELVDHLARLNHHAGSAVQRTVRHYEHELLPSLERMGGVVDQLERRSAAASERAEAVDKAMERMTLMLRDAAGAYEASAADAKAQREQLREAQRALHDEAALTIQQTKAIGVAAGETHASVRRSLATLQSDAAAAGDSLAQFSGKVRDLALDPSRAQAALEELGTRVSAAAKHADDAVVQLTQTIDRYADTADSVDRSAQAIRRADLETVLNSLRSEIDRLEVSVRDRSALLAGPEAAQLRATVESTLNTARNLNSALDEIVDAATRRLRAI